MTRFELSALPPQRPFELDEAWLFTPALRSSLDSLRSLVSSATGWPVQVDYGITDDGAQHWAALTVEDLPTGATGHPGVLVSVVMGDGVCGFAAVASADGRETLCTVTSAGHIDTGLQIAGAEALRAFEEMAEGAFA